MTVWFAQGYVEAVDIAAAMGLVIFAADGQVHEGAIEKRADGTMADEEDVSASAVVQRVGDGREDPGLRGAGGFPAVYALVRICEELAGGSFKFRSFEEAGCAAVVFTHFGMLVEPTIEGLGQWRCCFHSLGFAAGVDGRCAIQRTGGCKGGNAGLANLVQAPLRDGNVRVHHHLRVAEVAGGAHLRGHFMQDARP